jgi:transaldolase
MVKLGDLSIEIYVDGADVESFMNLNSRTFVKGFTTNPSLMKKSGVKNYADFAKDLLSKINDKPISFEVFADDFESMEFQAKKIASWGQNVFVKIPITNTKGDSSKTLIQTLNKNFKIPCNVTAIFTLEQVQSIVDVVDDTTPLILSIFAGRIADSGIDPLPIIKKAIDIAKNKKNIKILWASTRELFNIFQANKINCHIITVPNEILKKIEYVGKDQNSFSLETVTDFYKDAKSAGFKI